MEGGRGGFGKEVQEVVDGVEEEGTREVEVGCVEGEEEGEEEGLEGGEVRMG